MNWPGRLKELVWIDLGTGSTRHFTKGKLIGFKHAQEEMRGGGRALDLGCGDGFWSRKLETSGYQVTSVDHEKYYQNTQIVNLEQSLPFPDQSFDLVWSTEVLEHLFTPSHLVREIERILRPQGLLVLTTPNSYFWIYPLFRIFGYRPRDLQNPDHKQFFHLNDIRKLFPGASVYGFFPYLFLKMTISHPVLVKFLSPTFVVVARRENL